jgi:hypothetical protein
MAVHYCHVGFSFGSCYCIHDIVQKEGCAGSHGNGSCPLSGSMANFAADALRASLRQFLKGQFQEIIS